MECVVEYTDEFGGWWSTLTEEQQIDVSAVINLLEVKGTKLDFPYSSGLHGSYYSHMRELRVQSSGNPLRILYAFDPRRVAILLIGDNKKSNKRWYDRYIKIADKLYKDHLEQLKRENLIP